MCSSDLSRSKYARKEQWREEKQSEENRGQQLQSSYALPEIHFVHAIYRFKAQEVKNPKIQTVYDLDLK